MQLIEATQHFGNKSKLAKSLGITRSAINRWRQQGIPLVRQYQIEVLTNGQLKAERTES